MPTPGRAIVGGLLVALAAGVLFLHGLDRYPLFDPDEARHAEVAREMAAAQGMRALFLPTLDFRPYREKPAGYYWLVALAYHWGGVGETAARSVSALAALVGVLAIYAYGARHASVAAGVGAALVAATTVGWLGLARLGILDMTVTACIAVGVLAGLAWMEHPEPRRPPIAPYVAAGLGTLVKGPIGAALIAGPLVLAALARRPRPAVGGLGLGRGIALTAGIAAVLYVPLAIFDPSYVAAFAATNFRRLVPASPHAAPVWYYFVWIPVLFLPWTLFAPRAVVRAARDPRRRALVLWAAFVPVFLSLAHGKLATYALSALVPLALVVGEDLAGVVMEGAHERDEALLAAAGWVAVLALGAIALAAPWIAHRYPVSIAGRVLAVLASLGAAAGIVAVLRAGRLALVPVAVLGATITLYALALRFVLPAAGALHSDRDAAALIATAGSAPVVAFGIHDPSLTFYLRAPTVTTDDAELVRTIFAGDGPAFVVTGHRHFAKLEEILGARAH